MSLYISKQQLENRLKGKSTLETVNKHENAGGAKKNNSHELKVLIGTLGNLDTQANVAKEFGVSNPLVSMHSRGMSNSIGANPKLQKDVKEAVATTKEDLRERSLGILASALGVVDDKIHGAKSAAEASVVAKNLAFIHKTMSPQDEMGNKNNINILIHVPQQKEEKDYEVISV